MDQHPNTTLDALRRPVRRQIVVEALRSAARHAAEAGASATCPLAAAAYYDLASSLAGRAAEEHTAAEFAAEDGGE